VAAPPTREGVRAGEAIDFIQHDEREESCFKDFTAAPTDNQLNIECSLPAQWPSLIFQDVGCARCSVRSGMLR
jgi:hypothetical protein